MKADLDKLVHDETLDALIATDRRGNIVYWNRGAENIFGFAADEVIGGSVEQLIVPPNRIEEERQLLAENPRTAPYSYYCGYGLSAAVFAGGGVQSRLQCLHRQTN